MLGDVMKHVRPKEGSEAGKVAPQTATIFHVARYNSIQAALTTSLVLYESRLKCCLFVLRLSFFWNCYHDHRPRAWVLQLI